MREAYKMAKRNNGAPGVIAYVSRSLRADAAIFSRGTIVWMPSSTS